MILAVLAQLKFRLNAPIASQDELSNSTTVDEAGCLDDFRMLSFDKINTQGPPDFRLLSTGKFLWEVSNHTCGVEESNQSYYQVI